MWAGVRAAVGRGSRGVGAERRRAEPGGQVCKGMGGLELGSAGR